MRVAALYDIHANLPALEAVLEEVSGLQVDQIVIGGDMLPGPMPRESLERVLAFSIPTRFILGNGDREVLAQMRGEETDWYRTAPEAWRVPVRWTAKQLLSEHQRIIAAWPATCSMAIHGLGEALFCHASPRNDTDNFTRLTPDDRLAPLLTGIGAPVVVCGHTHMQFDRTVGGVRVVNAGSVGMPFGEPGAYWLLLGPDIELRHTSYDLASAAEQVRATHYPQAESFAAQSIFQPPSEAEMLAIFASAESRA